MSVEKSPKYAIRGCILHYLVDCKNLCILNGNQEIDLIYIGCQHYHSVFVSF